MIFFLFCCTLTNPLILFQDDRPLTLGSCNLPEKRLPEITFPHKAFGRNCIIPNVHFPECALARNYTFQNVHSAELTFPQKVIFQKYYIQRWSSPGRPWPRGRPRGHILKSLALASKPQVLENCPVLGSITTLFFEQLKFCWKTPETSRKICKHLFCFPHLEHRRRQREEGRPPSQLKFHQ